MVESSSADSRAFTDLFDRYAQAIYRHCFFRLRDAQLAEDILQETFVRMWEYLAKGKHADNERAFLYRIANNLIVDEVRRIKRRPTVSLDVMVEAGIEPSHEPMKELQGEMERQRLFSYLDQVGEPYREILILRYVDQCSPREIAVILGRSAPVVSVQLHRAVRKLRSLLPHA